MPSSRAPILLHGATGFTGRLVAAELAAANIHFAISGRDRTKLADLAATHAGLIAETVVVDIRDSGSVAAAVEGRALVIACAGPFVDVGMPILAACARLGVHYVDTTGEQSFVRAAFDAHHETARATGAVIVPGMAYEIAPADWAASLASARVGGAPDHLDIVYLPEVRNGLGAATSRGTRKTMLRMAAIGDTDAYQYVQGARKLEPAAEYVKTFEAVEIGGHARSRRAMSFPSPEAIVTPAHTGARTVRTFMGASAPSSEMAHLLRNSLPTLARWVEPLANRVLAGGVEGPLGEARATRFVIFAEATVVRPERIARVTVRGVDPYGVTARILTHAAKAALAGNVGASGAVIVGGPNEDAKAVIVGGGSAKTPTNSAGVVAPSVGYPAPAAFASLDLTVEARDL